MTFRDNISWYKKMVVEELQNSLTYRNKVETLYNAYTDTFIVFLIDERTNNRFKYTVENFTEELCHGLDLQTIVGTIIYKYKAYILKQFFR